MQIKVRKENKDGIVRLESSGDVKEILINEDIQVVIQITHYRLIINEDILHPDQESISVCYRGKNSSGIVDFTPAEIEKLYDSIRSRIHLIKGFKRLSGGGAKKF